jgi:hypothetical protein
VGYRVFGFLGFRVLAAQKFGRHAPGSRIGCLRGRQKRDYDRTDPILPRGTVCLNEARTLMVSKFVNLWLRTALGLNGVFRGVKR